MPSATRSISAPAHRHPLTGAAGPLCISMPSTLTLVSSGAPKLVVAPTLTCQAPVLLSVPATLTSSSTTPAASGTSPELPQTLTVCSPVCSCFTLPPRSSTTRSSPGKGRQVVSAFNSAPSENESNRTSSVAGSHQPSTSSHSPISGSQP